MFLAGLTEADRRRSVCAASFDSSWAAMHEMSWFRLLGALALLQVTLTQHDTCSCCVWMTCGPR